jgi:GNAT superfamily N-acetyltransferase
VLDLHPTPYDHPDVTQLNGEIQQFYVRLYGGGDSSPMDAREFVSPRGLFLVGYAGGVAVACGGWRARGDDGDTDPDLRPGDAEIKRMYVVESHRGRGYARTVLAELERTAAASGRLRVVLETGIPQPEAIALYTSSGYEQIPSFGDYRCSPDSVCYAKYLTRRLRVSDSP